MKGIATILLVFYLTVFLSAPMNMAINTRWGVPLFVFAMAGLAIITVILSTYAWPAEFELLPGTEEKDAEREKQIT